MKIPAKVRITSKVSYEVVFAEKVADDPECRGICRFDPKQIVLLMGQSEQMMVKTFLHEVLHAVDHEHEIGLQHKHVYALEDALAKLFRLNKLFSKKSK